jgi:predicted CxxxxCH...CXXCH cytochrome family protein
MLSRFEVTYPSFVDHSAGDGQNVALGRIKCHSDGFESRSWELEVFAAPSWMSQLAVGCVAYAGRRDRCCYVIDRWGSVV